MYVTSVMVQIVLSKFCANMTSCQTYVINHGIFLVNIQWILQSGRY